MGTVVGFTVGYLAGTRAGSEGRAAAVRAVRSILAAEEVEEVTASLRAIAGDVTRRVGGRALGELREVLGQRAGQAGAKPGLIRAA